MSITPSLSNYFYIEIDLLANPYLRSTIKPYIPSDDQEFIKSSGRVYQSYLRSFNLDNTGAIFYELKDPFALTFSLLGPKDLAHFSQVSKCCFLASKFPLIWECQFIKLLPNVKIIPTDACIFSHEEQFKIIFKRINDELKPYIWQFNRNNEILNELRGSNGMSGTIDDAWRKYVKAVETKNNDKRILEQAKKGLLSEDVFPDPMILWPIMTRSCLEMNRTYINYKCLDRRRIHLAGNEYDGTAETIDQNSQQGQLLDAIDIIPGTFNEQDQYKTIILLSEIFKKAALIPQNDGNRVPGKEFAEESWCFVS